MIVRQLMHSGLSGILFGLLFITGLGFHFVYPAYADTDKGIQAFNQRDYKTAFREFLSSAQAGNAEAQCAVGSMLMLKINPPGTGTDADAEAWLFRAAKQGNVRAMAWLGKFYDSHAQNSILKRNIQSGNTNRVTNTDSLSKFELSRMSGVNRQTINPSMSNGALSSFFGGSSRIPQQANSANAPWHATPPLPRYGVPKLITDTQNPVLKDRLINRELNFQKARYWFQQAAENGNRYAMEQLADLLDAGLGGPQNAEEAGRWRTRMKHTKDKIFALQSNNYPMEP